MNNFNNAKIHRDHTKYNNKKDDKLLKEQTKFVELAVIQYQKELDDYNLASVR